MQNKSRAFTLIELLVVVLIIGILAAVAVPQYQKAVEKARAAEALTILDGIYQAAQVYYLANGTYPTKFDDLEVGMNWTGTEEWRADSSVMKDTRSNSTWSLQLYQEEGYGASAYVGRISGPYAGTGFGKGFKTGKLLCIEKTGEGYVYDGAEDSYCVKIFGATKDATYNNGRYYQMP